MLFELRIKNLGIIEDMNWRLRDGLNVITGETGAGKSLVIDAVESLLAGTADEEVIRYGADEAQIEGVFTLPQREKFSPLRELLARKKLTADKGTLAIDCEFHRQGPSIIRVNGHTVPKVRVQRLLRQRQRTPHHRTRRINHALYIIRGHFLILDSYNPV